MEFNRIKHITKVALASLALLPALAGCREETFDAPDYTTSGEDVTVTLSVKIPEMQTMTRAALNEYNRNMVNNVYIRSYSASTGAATSKWVKDETFTPGQQPIHNDNSVDFTFDTQSGYNYIVAVANVEENSGFIAGESTDPQPLIDLLNAADTWEDFLKIVAISPTGDFMTNPSVPLPMAGCYFPESDGVHPLSVADWQNEGFQAYFIPVQRDRPVTLRGAIHLRRLISEINFNFKPGTVNSNGNQSGIEITVNSFEVVNVPRYSWLYERPTKGNLTANYGDNATSEDDAANFYASQYFAGNLVQKNPDNSSSFYFYMDENKHTGNASCTNYNDRDKKTAAGWYAALTKDDADTWSPNQMATYVRVSCTIDYTNQITVNDEGQLVTPGSGSEASRVANVDYFIHLGYIGRQAADFNSYRNCKYTYNVTVNGVNDIVVDAYADDETYHGEEGTVVDLRNATIDLDAHYHAFNIQLTQEELQNPDFGFIIMTSRNGMQYVFDDEDDFRSGHIGGNASYADRELYNWIELHPTTDATTLAAYRPRFGSNAGADSNGKITFLLTNLKATRNAGGEVISSAWNNMTEQMRSTSGWYTVFVNEYTYEPMYEGQDSYANESARSRWKEYVNQNPRRFYIKTQRKASPDGNSVYAPSKYGVSQNSMQSYYSSSAASATAIGAEWVNETMGMNMRSSFGGNQPNNGRTNVAHWLSGSNDNLTINSTSVNQRPLWSTFVTQTQMQNVGGVTGERAQNGPEIEARTGTNAYKVPRLAAYSGNASPTFNDPQGSSTISGTNISSFIENINACMNRNRDNNGNGRIDPDELRWYVPSIGKYLRMTIGEQSLEEPLMKWDVSRLPTVNSGSPSWGGTEVLNDYLSRYMFLASNNTVLWAMEGLSTSTKDQALGWSNQTSHPWQVRCIRNLGTDLTTVGNSDDDGVQPAYTQSGNIISMTYYDVASIRANRYSGNGNGNGQMPVHYINDDEYNKLYRSFEFSTSDITIANKGGTGMLTPSTIQNYINSNPCSSLSGTGWRVPNLKELAIMRNLGVLTGAGNIWISCTALYYNMADGKGGGMPISNDNYIMIMFHDHGSIGRDDQLSGSNQRLRCVRDVN